ncbi:pyrroline-5-carboxylate reductase [Bacillus salitolerans]|uniref:Pyrroline-5-carboxylate reductase n=1 Tax=Bacillus salitolerans TaxID=1437434 RepID=A0ABW4LV10_9BACI
MNKRIGFIGCGKMAQAIISGMIKSNITLPNQIIASAKSNQTLTKVENEYGILTTTSNEEVTRFSDFLFLAIKPNLYQEILEEIKDSVGPETILITIAAGINLSFMEESLGNGAKVVRTMPNTPSLVGEGMSAICVNQNVTQAEMDEILALYHSFGKAEIVEEALMDAIPAISGSSPAYVYMFIEALADGGVLQGIPRHQAYKLAAQAVLGAAKMVLETEKHPGELKDQVCTPGGATIEAVSALEKHNFRGAVLTAMEQCTAKTMALSKK